MNLSFDSNNKLKQSPIAKWIKVDDASGGPIPRPRHGHRAVALKEYMIVFGGGNEGIVDELHVYDVNKNKWFVPVVRGDIPRGFAAYGMVTDQSKVFIFGGMIEYGRYSSDMYELQTNRWEWRRLRVRSPQSGHPGPCPRLGHTFTLGFDHYAYVFGGLANESEDPKINIPKYLNDLYAVNLSNSQGPLWWELPVTHGQSPAPRESHTAVHFVTQTGKEQLIIYGGMDGHRMSDVWILDMNNWTWSNPVPNGIEPLPRSLHTANIVGNRMFIFGGWVPLKAEEKAEQPDKEWKCTNSLASLNLNTLTWEKPVEPKIAEQENLFAMPGARAGHSSVVINKRIYIWSGRDGYKKSWNSQVCCDDMWYLEVEPPSIPAGIQLIRASISSLEIQWTPVANVDNYVLQIQKVEQPQVDGEHRKRVTRAVPLSNSVRMFRPATYRQQRPLMIVPRAVGTVMQASEKQVQQRIVVQKANQNPIVTAEHVTTQQQKLVIIQPHAKTVESKFIKPIQQQQQTTGYEVLPSQGTTAKTTYTTPVVSTIDQTMPTNILDEALNEAENFVDELQQQQKQQAQLEQQQTLQKAAEEDFPTKTETVKKICDPDEDIKFADDNKVEEGTTQSTEVENQNMKDRQDALELPVEQLRASDHKESDVDEKELDPTQQGESVIGEDLSMGQQLSLAEQLQPDQKEPQDQKDQNMISPASEENKIDNLTPSVMELPQSLKLLEGDYSDLLDEDIIKQQESSSSTYEKNINETNVLSTEQTQRDQIAQQNTSQIVHSSEPNQSPPSTHYPSFASIQSAADQWFDVATLAENKCLVTHYMAPMDEAEQEEILRQEGLSATQEYRKLINLEPGVGYRFRVCAVNSVGQSKWSPVNSFKTCMPGYPGAPSSIKITKSAEGAHILWEQPQTTNGHIIEYSVYLAMRSASLASPAFVPVYIGPAPNCMVNHQNLQLAHIDASPKPAIIFRIAARNEKGYGPATQVRWLQDQHPMAMLPTMTGVAAQQRRHISHPSDMMASSAGAGVKRAYPYQHIPVYNQQPMASSGGRINYYGASPGESAKIMHSTAPTPANTPNMSMVVPLTPESTQRTLHAQSLSKSSGSSSSAMVTPVILHRQPTQTATTSTYVSSVSPQHQMIHQIPVQQVRHRSQPQSQRQQRISSDTILMHGVGLGNVGGSNGNGGPPPNVDPAISVREYLTGGSKRMRLEQ